MLLPQIAAENRNEKIAPEKVIFGIDKGDKLFYYKSPPSEEHKTAGEKSQKTSKKLLTNERTHGILNELRLERVESTEP